MELKKYLPIGTVVMLKGGTKRVMIVGFCPVAENEKNTVWDYSGCLYPEGVISSTESCLFNHNQIENIYHLGLIDEEEKIFKDRLSVAVNELTENLNDIHKNANEDINN